MLKYLIIEVDIAPLRDKEWSAWMPSNDPWEVFMWADGTAFLQLLKLHPLDGCVSFSLQFLALQIFVIPPKENNRHSST